MCGGRIHNTVATIEKHTFSCMNFQRCIGRCHLSGSFFHTVSKNPLHSYCYASIFLLVRTKKYTPICKVYFISDSYTLQLSHTILGNADKTRIIMLTLSTGINSAVSYPKSAKSSPYFSLFFPKLPFHRENSGKWAYLSRCHAKFSLPSRPQTQFMRLRDVVRVGSCCGNRMDIACSGICTGMDLHAEVPLIPLLRGVHLRIAGLCRVLGRTRRMDDRCVNNRTAVHDESRGFQPLFHVIEHLAGDVVLFEQVRIVQNCRGIGVSVLWKSQSPESASWHSCRKWHPKRLHAVLFFCGLRIPCP